MFCNAKNKKKSSLFLCVFAISISKPRNTSRSILPHFFGMCWTKCFPVISSSFMFLRTFAPCLNKSSWIRLLKEHKRFSWPTSMARCTVDANNLFKHEGIKKTWRKIRPKSMYLLKHTNTHTHTAERPLPRPVLPPLNFWKKNEKNTLKCRLVNASWFEIDRFHV